MKKACVIACSLLFVAIAGFAETPSPAPLTSEALAAILGSPADAGACGLPGKAAFGMPAPQNRTSTCTVTCPSGTVSCTSSGTCTAVDRNCSILEAGHVTCDGVTTSCTPACCTGGTVQQNACCRCNATGTCFDCCRCDGGTVFQCSRVCAT